ncbi:alpha/beta hydrolase [Granulicella mallensis]|uniref:Pimeloyl-ACP methyl ester carboxylesterase n=1 Tax=Granulicella mallensis TaxID=940614 RepID=A0A7W7ZNY5_9BACT|nr:alpha/beta hydrolase [Granulicella mallensis]MBB5063044.1 pimeloyl-ACP methyl ester carboxylesterase [Granulicella mallensis]
MAHFTVLTGSETRPLSWQTLQTQLEISGHTTAVVSLNNVSWASGLDAAADALAQKVGPTSRAILIGHSIAGLVLPALGDRLGAMSEIYVAAFPPQRGQSFFDRLLSGEEIYDPTWVDGYQSLIRSKDPLTTHRHFLDYHLFHDCRADTADLYWKKSELPLDVIYSTPYLSELSLRSRHYIVCASDRTVRPEWQRHAASLLPYASVTEIDCGHCPQIARPVELAQQLLLAANHLDA